MSVEIRHLRYFLAVAEELHFGRAAQRLSIAQPALSQQVKKLEREVGAELFHRTRRKVELTAAGKAMIRPARAALAELAAATLAARRTARGEIGHLTVGFIESAAAQLIPLTVRRFRTSHPEVGLTLRELGVAAQLEALRSHALDLGIVRGPVGHPGFVVEPLADERLVVAVPAGHALAGRARIGAARIAREPQVLLARDVVPALYDQVIALLEHHGGALVAQEATSIQAVLGLVAAQLGVSLLPESVRTLSRRGVRFVTLANSPTSTLLAVRRRDERSPLTDAFLAAARGA